MKILHVIPSFAPAWRYGGVISTAVGLTRELARLGHDVTVMTTNIDGPDILDVPLDRPVFMDGVEVQYFAVEHPRWYCFSRPLGQGLRQQVSCFDLVHIHSMFLWPTTIAAYWCRRRGVPYILLPQGALDPICLAKSYDRWWGALGSRMKKWSYLNTLGRLDLQRAAAIHFTAEAEMDAAGPLRLRPPGFIVPLGIELAEVEEEPSSLRLRERFPQLGERKLVLFLSRLDPKKGLNLLVEALGELAARRKDFALVVAGSGATTYEAEVAALVRSHDIEDRVVFLGFVQGRAKWWLLQEVDLFVLPSYQENFGLAVAEAMVSGVPVVISNRVNIHREVSRARAGLVTGLDAKEIASAIEQLLVDGDLRREMGRGGKHLVHEHFSWQGIAKDMLEVYQRIVRGDPPTARRTPQRLDHARGIEAR
jgi:glycosyltransferase involved in cell wall biosynthesis